MKNQERPDNSAQITSPLEIINKIDEAVFASRSLNDVLDIIVEAVADLIQVPICTLWLLDPESGKLNVIAARGWPLSQPRGPDYQIGTDSFTGQILKTKQPVTSPDIQQEPKFIHRKLAQDLKLTSALVIPILARDEKILGAIALYSVDSPRTFTEHDQQIIVSFASQVATRIEQMQLLEQQQRNLQITSCLHRVDEALASAPGLGTLLRLILEEARTLLDGSGAILYFNDEEGQANKVVAAIGTAQKVEGMKASPDRSLGGWVVKHRQAVYCAIDDKRVAQEVAQGTDAANVVAVPLVAEGSVLGSLIVLDHREKVRNFQTQDAQLLRMLAPHATSAINRMRHYERTTRNSDRLAVVNDVLTWSVQADTIDVDALLQKTALAIQKVFGFRVDIGIKQADRLLFKAVASYLGQEGNEPWTAPFTKGITGAAFSSRETIVLDDINKDPRYYSVADDTQSELAIPLLLADQESIGVLNIESQEFNAFADPEVQRVFESIAATLTIAIENARRLKELTVLNEITTTVNAVRNLSQMAQAIVEKVVELFDAQAGRLFLATDDGSALKLLYHIGADELAQRTAYLKRRQSIAGKVLDTGETIFLRDMVTDPRADGVARPEDGIRSLIDVPIWADNKILGVLAVLTSSERTYTQLDIQILEAIGKNIGATVERVRLDEGYRHLYGNATDPILTLDLDGTITNVNPATEELTGYTSDELIGCKVADLVPDEQIRRLATDRIQQMAQGKRMATIEVTISCANGENLIFESKPTPVKDSDDNVTYIQAHWRDITQRRRQEEFLRQLARQIRHHQFNRDELLGEMAQRIVQITKSHDCYIHLLRDESDVLEAFIYPQSPYLDQIRGYPLKIGEGIIGHVAKNSEGLVIQDTHSSSLNKDIPFMPPRLVQHIVAVPMLVKEGTIGVLSILRYGKQAIPYNDTDHDLLAGLADTLAMALDNRRLDENQTREQAAKIILEQVNLISMFLSHKLGNLIPAMNFTIRELRRRLDSANGTIDELMTTLEGTGDAAINTINLFRDMGRPLTQDATAVDLPAIVKKALEMLPHLPPEIQVTVDEIAHLPPVRAQKVLLVEVVQGIIHNAIEAMPEEGHLIISARRSRDHREVRLRFTNTGPGIRKEHQQRIFEPFFTTKQDRAGTGLGLWLSRLYLRSIGGDITIYSKSEQGTHVTLYLRATQHDPESATADDPLQSEKSLQITPPLQIRSTFNELKILVVDDDPHFRSSLSYPLQRYGFTVYNAKNKEEAEALFENGSFNAFVVDMRLVDYDVDNRDGMDLVEQIRRRDDQTPILLISAYPESVSQARHKFAQCSNIMILNKTADSQLEGIFQQLAEKNLKGQKNHNEIATKSINSRRRDSMADRAPLLAGTPQD